MMSEQEGSRNDQEYLGSPGGFLLHTINSKNAFSKTVLPPTQISASHQLSHKVIATSM